MHKKIFLLIVLDQITKLLLWPRDFSFGPIHIHPVKNFGLIFSLNFGAVVNLIIIVIALGFFVYYFWYNNFQKNNLGRWILILIIAGAASNLIDRIYLTYVQDFLDLG